MVFCHTFVLGDCLDHPRAQGLSRLSLCSGTVPTTLVLGTVSTALVLGDCPDYLCARGLSRLRLFSEIRHFHHAVLGDCPDHSPTIARGLLSSATCDLYSHTVERHLFFFSLKPYYKAHTSPSSKLGDYIGTMHLPVQLVSLVRRLDSQLNWEFFLDPGTTCLRHLLPDSGTKWAHFTLR